MMTRIGLVRLMAILLTSCCSCCHGHSEVTEKSIKVIEQYMNTSTDPCNDYFNYACGNWGEYHTNGRYTESTGLVDHEVNKRLVNYIESYAYGKDSITDMTWTYYKSCRYQRTSKHLRYLKIIGSDEDINWLLLELIKNKTDTWESAEFDWMPTVAKLRKYGLKNVLMEHLVLQNLTNPTEYVIDIDSPTIDGTAELPNILSMISILKDLGLARPKAFIMSRRLKTFEIKLKELLQTVNDDNENDTEVEILNIANIETKLPYYSWQKYFDIILDHTVPKDYKFQLRNSKYFEKLNELLKQTDPEILSNYMAFLFLVFLSLDATSSSDKIDCMVDVRSKMDLALNYIYGEHFYSKHADIYNKDVQEIINVLRDELRKKLYENKINLTDDEQTYLIRKLNVMEVNMGNLPKTINHEFVEQYYHGIELDRYNYYRNHLSLLHLRFRKEHEPLFKGSPNPDDFFFIADSDTARSSTPFYLMRQNLIVVPFGFLQPPIYHHNMHSVLKYSLLGFNIAHEIAHGFDASGVHFDYGGVVHDTGDNISQNERFSRALECMQREETTSIDERIADIVGLRLAYDAFFHGNAIQNIDQNETLNGHMMRKLFFLNFAQFFCGNMESEFMDHDSDNVRIQETLLNFEGFAETYECDLGSTLHPEEKCRLW